MRYHERLWVPWWWWPPALGLAALIALEVNQGVQSLPNWLPFAILLPVAAVVLGRQLDPAAYVVHRAWIGPMVLLVLDDPDDPTPYWLVSTRHPDRVLAALRG